MASNAEIEQRWIDAWSDLAEIVRALNRDVPCLLPDGAIVPVEDCQGWLQESAYLGFQVRVAAGWVRHRRGVIAQRWHDTAAQSFEGPSAS